ncbi:MAG: nucleotide exchange factor GrpE [Spirochaetaceae bacterium]|nr:nucleotide exchange factor GrpE [Spirochaetaceae bacterium]
MSKHTHDTAEQKKNNESVTAGMKALPAEGRALDRGKPAGKVVAAAADTTDLSIKNDDVALTGAEPVPNAGEGPTATETDVLKAELEQARQKADEFQAKYNEVNEKYLRTLAEEVNFRKRMTREKDEAGKFAVSSLLSDLVPVLDDFDRGIASAETSNSYEKLHEGVLIIQKQLSQMLENKYSLKRFESKGKLFDPNRHEALFAEPDAVEEATVSEEYLPGYSLHDRVLRTAKVRVKVPAPKKSPEDPQARTESGSEKEDTTEIGKNDSASN